MCNKGKESGNGIACSVTDSAAPFCLTMAQCEQMCSIVEEGEGFPCIWRLKNSLAGQTLIIEAKDSDNFETVLVFHFMSVQRIVVESVVLTNKRQGTLTKLMCYIFKSVRNMDTRLIEIQSVLTPEMVSWCRSRGFVQNAGHTYDEHGCGGSYFSEAQDNLYFNALIETGN